MPAELTLLLQEDFLSVSLFSSTNARVIGVRAVRDTTIYRRLSFAALSFATCFASVPATTTITTIRSSNNRTTTENYFSVALALQLVFACDSASAYAGSGPPPISTGSSAAGRPVATTGHTGVPSTRVAPRYGVAGHATQRVFTPPRERSSRAR